jgi:hypothetical protein
MARRIIPALLTADYTSDRGRNVEGVGFRFGAPTDFSDAEIDNLLAAAGARRKTAADRTGCPVASEFNPRKLRFQRRDGNSLSVVIRDKDAAIGIATSIRNVINGSGNPVQCIELIGEEWDDLLPELKTGVGAPTPGTPSRSNLAGKQYAHSGKILYEYDSGAGKVQTVGVRVDTDIVTAAGVTSPPSILGAGGAWINCVGPFEIDSPCSAKASLISRRYIGSFLTSADPANPAAARGYQTTEVPVRSTDAADILACGTLIANGGSIVCLRYAGETNKRLHLLLP